MGINDVKIRVLATGICGTDLHIYEWDAWARSTIKKGLTIGHEFVGEVVATGSNVTDVPIGHLSAAKATSSAGAAATASPAAATCAPTPSASA